jgi:hypothetical protein
VPFQKFCSVQDRRPLWKMGDPARSEQGPSAGFRAPLQDEPLKRTGSGWAEGLQKRQNGHEAETEYFFLLSLMST